MAAINEGAKLRIRQEPREPCCARQRRDDNKNVMRSNLEVRVATPCRRFRVVAAKAFWFPLTEKLFGLWHSFLGWSFGFGMSRAASARTLREVPLPAPRMRRTPAQLALGSQLPTSKITHFTPKTKASLRRFGDHWSRCPCVSCCVDFEEDSADFQCKKPSYLSNEKHACTFR